MSIITRGNSRVRVWLFYANFSNKQFTAITNGLSSEGPFCVTLLMTSKDGTQKALLITTRGIWT